MNYTKFVGAGFLHKSMILTKKLDKPAPITVVTQPLRLYQNPRLDCAINFASVLINII